MADKKSLAMAYAINRRNSRKMPKDKEIPMGHIDEHEEHYEGIADAILHKKRMADGGEVPSDEPLIDNSVEHGNLEDDLSFDALDDDLFDEEDTLKEASRKRKK